MEYIIYEKNDAVATIKLNRPKALNALNSDVLRDFAEAVNMAEADNEVRVIIITGEGKAFAAGADIGAMADMYMKEGLEYCESGQKLFRRLELLRKPVIAAINGFALGGGCELALACDIRVASSKAVMGLPETGLGVIPGFGGTQRMARLIGTAKTKELIFTARSVKADEACQIGLVNCVVESEELMPAALSMAKEIAGKAPLAVALVKDAVNKGIQTDIDTSMEIDLKNVAAIFSTEDLHEGMRAFMEKRKPEFKNR